MPAPITTDENEALETAAREDVTVMDQVALGIDELKAKIVQLTKQLTEVEGLKKSADKGFNDEIKDLKTEIKQTLDLLKEAEGNS